MLESAKQATFRAVAQALHPHDTEDTVVVAGAPRSGTTWVAEVLRELDGYKLLNEPLFLSNFPEAKDAGFSWRTYIAPRSQAPIAESYLHAALTGRMPLGPGWRFQAPTAFGKLLEHVNQPRTVVKFCRANRLLQWMAGTFDLRGLILVVRHPCAVMSSQLRHGGWDTDQYAYAEDWRITSNLPEEVLNRYSSVLSSLSSRLEVMTAVWCLDYYLPLLGNDSASFPWLLLPYERLVRYGQRELDRIGSFIGVDATAEMERSLGRPSFSAQGDVRSNAESQLAKWKDHLSTSQISTILEIVEQFGLSRFYSADTEPDYDALNRYQTQEARW